MESKHTQNKVYTGVYFIPIIMLFVFSLIGITIWSTYRDQLMENQKAQLLLNARTIADNINFSFTEYKDDLEFLSNIDQKKNFEIYDSFLACQSKYENNLFWEGENGNIEQSIYPINLTSPVLISRINASVGIWLYESRENDYVIVLKKELNSGEKIGLVIDAEAYYEQLISDIHIGKNGYIVVKSAEGIIVMHPEKEQWGIHVINGRKEMYPGLDFTSLDNMVKEQQSGEEGLSEYYSYWWGTPELARVKKISAYAPANIGDNFWIISAVVDYDDFYEPLETGFRRLTLVFCIAIVFFAILFFYIWKLNFEQRKASEEIKSLTEMNERLEEIHRGQEMLSHQQRLQVMGTMTGGIAHEFNNFLTPIMGFAELLLLDIDEDTEAYDNALEIYKASEKASEIVRQISSLSRRNVETVYKSNNIKKMLQRSIKMIKSICPPNVMLSYDFSIAEEHFLGNATQIDEVILNICVNALHAIGNKEGNLTIEGICKTQEELEKVVVFDEISFSKEWERYLQISIKDDGCGMDKDTLRQIFDPFFTTKKTGEGTGLGLSLAEQIILSHRGHIAVESEVGVGTTFYILIPLINSSIADMQINSSNKLKLVVADDNAKVLQMLEKNFSKLGLSIFTCRDKYNLEEILKIEKIDILVIDASLMDTNGIEFLMAMQGKYPDMCKIMMVDYFTKEIVEAKHKGIINGYVIKPVSDTAILEAIRECNK